MPNLNEIRSTDAVRDDAERWAVWTEWNLRWEAWEIKQTGVIGAFRRFSEILNGDGYELSDPKHPDYHSVHADLWDAREGK